MRFKQALLCVTLIALLVASACAVRSKPEGEARPIPARSDVLASIRLGDILEDQNLVRLADKLLPQLADGSTLDQALDEAEKELGVDLQTVTHILVFGAFDPVEGFDSDEYGGVFVKGPFDQSQLLAALEAEEGPVDRQVYKGQEIFTSLDGETSFTFLESEETLVGSQEAVRDVIDIRNGDAEALAGPLLESFNSLGDPLVKMALVIPEGAFDEAGLSGEIGVPGLSFDVFTDIQSIGLALDKQKQTLSLDISLDYPDEESASEAAEAYRGLISFVRAFIDVEALSQLLEKLEIQALESSVKISYSAALDELEATIEGLSELPLGFIGEEERPSAVPVPVAPQAPAEAAAEAPVPTPTEATAEAIAEVTAVAPTPTPFPILAPTPAATPGASRDCYNVRSDNDALKLINIEPAFGTPLQVGAAVKVIAEVIYFLDSHNSAVIAMGHSTAGGSTGFSRLEVSEGEGIATLEGEFVVPELAQLQLSLYLYPPSSAVKAAGYDCWRPLVSEIVVPYRLK